MNKNGNGTIITTTTSTTPNNNNRNNEGALNSYVVLENVMKIIVAIDINDF